MVVCQQLEIEDLTVNHAFANVGIEGAAGILAFFCRYGVIFFYVKSTTM
jgi:hypothetical protein